MKDIDRFWSDEAHNIRCVREEDYDAALSQLAALREELAKSESRVGELAQECSDLSGEIALFKSSDMMGSIKTWLDGSAAEICDAMEQRLAAAEQRNATLIASIVSLPEEFKTLSGCENTAGVYACIEYISDWVAELAKPTESGASE